jgi:hypothetical protein
MRFAQHAAALNARPRGAQGDAIICGRRVGIGDRDSLDLGVSTAAPNAAGDLAHGDASDEEGVRDERR